LHFVPTGEHQFEILDFVAAKFHEELGVFKLLVSRPTSLTFYILGVFKLLVSRPTSLTFYILGVFLLLLQNN